MMKQICRYVCVFVCVVVVVLSFTRDGGGAVMGEDTRRSVIAGSWYPGTPMVLRADIEKYCATVPVEGIDGEVVALVVPHAGYAYSGQVAAYAYKFIEGKSFDSVIVIGPSHRAYFPGASIYPKGGYETPLGVVAVDENLAGTIISKSEMISSVPEAHAQEHSVEIQLPFLQVLLGEFTFVPIIMGSQDRQTCEEVATAISETIKGKNVLIIASSDLSHFHGYDQAIAMDAIALKHIEEMDWKGLLDNLGRGTCEACGGGPVAATIMAARKLGADGSKVLHYANSGDVTGDRRGVVGYAAAVFYRKNSPEIDGKGRKAGLEKDLSSRDKKTLLEIARMMIQQGPAGKAADIDVASEVLKEQRGAFVTLKKHGQLRGCIGTFEARGPLFRTVEEMAQAAAFNDPRFPPVTTEELRDLSIEISALTPLRKVGSIDEIEVGKHGIYIIRGFYRGVLLPQVATEYGWDKITFLEETCHKAGLPADAWKDKDTEIFIFSAEVFSDGE